MNNKDTIMHRGSEPHERITRLCNVAIEAMQASEYYLADDKLIVMVTNDVTKSDFNRTESGMGFFNLNNPHDLINTILAHVQVAGKSYGLEVFVAESHLERIDPVDVLGEAIGRALLRMEEDEDNAAGK